MIKEALEYVVGLKSPDIKTLGGCTYSDKPLHRVEPYVIRNEFCVEFKTLTSLIDYVKAQVERDGIYSYKDLYILIENPTSVVVFEKDSPVDGKKTYICRAKAELPSVRYDYYYGSEEFNILLQSRFCPSDEVKELLAIVGNVKSSEVQTNSDNGVSQMVQTNKGIVLKENTKLPNPITLAPFRTFVEIEQVASPFTLRAKELPYADRPKDVGFALFEADGGAWKITATERIKKALEEAFIACDIRVLA